MPSTQTRIVGSGFTTFIYSGKIIAFLDEVHDSGQQPIRQYEAVTPLDAPYPVEFALPRVRAEGQLQLVIRELWNAPVWWALAGLTGTWNIVVYINNMANNPNPITCATIISKTPQQSSLTPATNTIVNPAAPTTSGAYRGWIYQNCVVTAIDDREAVQIGSLTFPRNISLVYAYKQGLQSGTAFN